MIDKIFRIKKNVKLKYQQINVHQNSRVRLKKEIVLINS
jgi:hypothetical protein